MKKIYLAGGMSNNWRGIITSHKYRAGDFVFLNPMEHKLNNPAEYTYWDLKAIDVCDILVGYMEQSNPSGFGLNLEIGYAKALGKTILLVVPVDFTRDDERSRYFDMARECADIIFHSLSDIPIFLDEIRDV